ncbi:hypothetical protein [Paenibacillus swuensis]|uniref:hypothetical protein n=1 Tax=Paenibacillus swuensis TaxID=1178515 RepID=UPI0018D40FA5|nr:hypothetical protein [Paenibacillus swuensis]
MSRADRTEQIVQSKLSAADCAEQIVKSRLSSADCRNLAFVTVKPLNADLFGVY